MRFSTLLFLACAASTEAFAPSASSAASFRTRSALSMAASGSEEKEIKVGVIGCGRIGIVHLGAITKAPNVRPVIVSNPTVSKAEKGACFIVNGSYGCLCGYLARFGRRNEVELLGYSVIPRHVGKSGINHK